MTKDDGRASMTKTCLLAIIDNKDKQIAELKAKNKMWRSKIEKVWSIMNDEYEDTEYYRDIRKRFWKLLSTEKDVSEGVGLKSK